MIGFEYKGQVAYITRIDDFRDYMEPEVYEAVRKAFENGCDGGLRQKYEELQAEYDELQTEYDILEDEMGDIDAVQAEREKCEQVRRCGNAVCPPIPAALVKANLPELCVAERTPNMRIESEQTGQLRFA